MKRGKNRHFGRFFKNFLLYFRKPAVCLVFFMQKKLKYFLITASFSIKDILCAIKALEKIATNFGYECV